MNITFDMNGKVLNIKRPDPARFGDVDIQREIIKSKLREDLTEVVESQSQATLKEMKSKNKLIKLSAYSEDGDDFSE